MIFPRLHIPLPQMEFEGIRGGIILQLEVNKMGLEGYFQFEKKLAPRVRFGTPLSKELNRRGLNHEADDMPVENTEMIITQFSFLVHVPAWFCWSQSYVFRCY
jgi:hypothetical protein